MQNHGPFTIGKDARRAASRLAVMCEKWPAHVHISRQLGEPLPIDQARIEALYARYQNVYGARPGPADEPPGERHDPRPQNTSLEPYEVWFLTGSQHLYGEAVLKHVAEKSQEIARPCSTAPPTSRPCGLETRADRLGRDPADSARANRTMP